MAKENVNYEQNLSVNFILKVYEVELTVGKSASFQRLLSQFIRKELEMFTTSNFYSVQIQF